MKTETIRKLDGIAKACVDGLEAEIRCGFTTPAMVRETESKTKNPTRLEVIKSMIRSDLRRARSEVAPAPQFMKAVACAMKSSEQANYLANAIDARLKRRTWSDRAFDGTYRELFGVRPRANRAAKRG